MRKLAVILMVGAVASITLADRVSTLNPELAVPGPATYGSRAFTTYATGFESPTYTTGLIGGQDGWVDGTDSAMEVVTSPAIGGQSLQSDGDKGWGSFRNIGDNAGGGTIAWSWYFDSSSYDAYGADQQFIPQSPTDGKVVTRINRDWDSENLRVLADDGSGSAVYYDLGYDIAWDQWVDFELTVAADKSFSLLMNGSSIFTGVGFSNNLEEIVVYNDGYSGNTMYVDDISVTPEPASLLLLGLAGVILRRR